MSNHELPLPPYWPIIPDEIVRYAARGTPEREAVAAQYDLRIQIDAFAEGNHMVEVPTRVINRLADRAFDHLVVQTRYAVDGIDPDSYRHTFDQAAEVLAQADMPDIPQRAFPFELSVAIENWHTRRRR